LYDNDMLLLYGNLRNFANHVGIVLAILYVQA